MRTMIRFGADTVGELLETLGLKKPAYACYLFGFRQYWRDAE